MTDGTAKFIVRDMRCKYSTGEIVALYGEPKAWDYLLLCDGSTVSEDNYPELCGVLGGNVLPNLVGRVLQGGSVSGEYKSAGLPNITGAANICPIGQYSAQSAVTSFFYANYRIGVGVSGLASGNHWNGVNFGDANLNMDASRSNAIYGSSSTVQPPAMTIKYYICYA